MQRVGSLLEKTAATGGGSPPVVFLRLLSMESRALVTASVSSGAFEVMLSEHFEDPQVLEAAVDPFLSVEFQETSSLRA